jgi:hypothetical protein
MQPTGPTYEADVKPIIQRRCGGCHVEGGIGPFALSTYEQVFAQRVPMQAAVEGHVMPPVLAAQDCTPYSPDPFMTDAEIATISAWASSDAPQGTPTGAAPQTQQSGLTRVDLTMPMPQAYVPQKSPDDYRCFVLDWPKDAPQYVVGFQARPGNARVVHHVIAYLIPPSQAAQFVSLDNQDPGLGYTCFGGAGGSGNAQWLGVWAPGNPGDMYPDDTGVLVQPGSKIILQVHYNTQNTGAGADASDLSSIDLALSPNVGHPGTFVPFTNFTWLRGGMTIPAFQSDVMHSYSIDPTPYLSLGSGGALASNRPFNLYSASAHQHLLGTKSHLQLTHKDGTTECLLDIPRWDFHWQRSYWFDKAKLVQPGDQLSIECHWDNSAQNQPTFNGVQQMPRDVNWGESTTDEMCLGVLYAAE